MNVRHIALGVCQTLAVLAIAVFGVSAFVVFAIGVRETFGRM